VKRHSAVTLTALRGHIVRMGEDDRLPLDCTYEHLERAVQTRFWERVFDYLPWIALAFGILAVAQTCT
jgi:hypothetical protein